MHDSLLPLRRLVGAWRSSGVASCPTTFDFACSGEVRVPPTAKAADRGVRSHRRTGDSLTCDMAVAAVGVGLTAHLHAELTKG